MLPQVTRPLSCFSLQKALLTRDSAEVTAGAVTEQASPPAVTGSVSYGALGLAESVFLPETGRNGGLYPRGVRGFR